MDCPHLAIVEQYRICTHANQHRHAPGMAPREVTPAVCERCTIREWPSAAPQSIPTAAEIELARLAPTREAAVPSRGLGDSIAKLTTALGIKPCGGCKQRQQKLNRWVPYRDAEPALRTDLSGLLVAIPAYGNTGLTARAVADCLREPIAVLVVDGMGDYQAHSGESVRHIPNAGWVGNCNYALQTLLREKSHDAIVLLNNDVRLSGEFFAGLAAAQQETAAGIVAASYNKGYPEAVPATRLNRFTSLPIHVPTGGVDGTCVLITRETVARVGLLDAATFPMGWGAMLDFCYRARESDIAIAITHAAYAEHVCGVTGRQFYGSDYSRRGKAEMQRGMTAKWGPEWRDMRRIPDRKTLDKFFPARPSCS